MSANTDLHNISFIDLKAQQAQIRQKVELAIHSVLDHGCYVNGPEVTQLESELADFCQAKHAISCANGTDALYLTLLAKGIQKGDAVFVPSFTFAASAEVIAFIGATPVFVDVCKDSFNIDLASLEEAINVAKSKKLIPKAIIAVDLFGLPADYQNINKLAEDNNLWVLADGAQSFGGSINGKQVGSFGLVTTTSFFPAKPLGCYGDGGSIFTDNDKLAADIRCLKSHGQGEARGEYIKVGMNSRLDSFQAAILLEKFKVFPQELEHRQIVANTYQELLTSRIQTPCLPVNTVSSWAQYTVRLPENINRDEVAAQLQERGIPTAIYYAKPLHQQDAYNQYYNLAKVNLANTEYLAKHVLSLPMDGYISLDKVNYIIENLNDIVK